MRCLSIDSLGELLLTGDESGSICVRLLHPRQKKHGRPNSDPRRSSNSRRQGEAEGGRGTEDTACRSQELGAAAGATAGAAAGAAAEGGLGAGCGGGGGGGVAKVLEGAHKGDVLAISHVEGSLRLSDGVSDGLSDGLSEEGDGVGGSWASLFVSGGKGEVT